MSRQNKAWSDSERQGPGRRYWIRSKKAARTFANARRRAGYTVDGPELVDDGTTDNSGTPGHEYTVWVSYGRKRTQAVRDTLAGIDASSAGGYR